MDIEKKVKEPLFHIVKRNDFGKKKAIIIRLSAVLIALLVSGIVSAILTKGDFVGFFEGLFKGTFGTERRIWNLLQGTAILLLISLALTPAFKMRFWNIGAEGQVLIGALACAACMLKLGGKVPDGVLIFISLGASIAVSMLWSVIPAFCKAKWNTNETLFTLMMNYVAMCLVNYFINIWVTSGSGTLGVLNFGHLPILGGKAYLLNILIVTAITVLVYIYLRFSKHGYEISVVGESENTARYIGINVKKVIVRTLLFTGVLCGIAAWLLVAGTSYTVNANLVAGRGFTGILVSWLARFNPAIIALTSFMVVFLQQGASQVATANRMGMAFSDIIIGIFFFFIIGCEFFINYKIVIRSKIKEESK